MANAAIFLGWGAAVPGREQAGLAVFNEGVQYWTKLQQQGEIESFEAVALEPHGGDLLGFVLIRGEREKLSRLRHSAEWQRLNIRADAVVQHLGVVDAHIGESFQQLLAHLQQGRQDIAG